jgi:hypothetical protein
MCRLHLCFENGSVTVRLAQTPPEPEINANIDFSTIHAAVNRAVSEVSQHRPQLDIEVVTVGNEQLEHDETKRYEFFKWSAFDDELLSDWVSITLTCLMQHYLCNEPTNNNSIPNDV